MSLKMTAVDYEKNILEVLNSIDVEDFSIVGDEVEYVMIEDTFANQIILDTIAIVSQSDYDVKENIHEGCIDITGLGFELANCWSSTEGFQTRQ